MYKLNCYLWFSLYYIYVIYSICKSIQMCTLKYVFNICQNFEVTKRKSWGFHPFFFFLIEILAPFLAFPFWCYFCSLSSFIDVQNLRATSPSHKSNILSGEDILWPKSFISGKIYKLIWFISKIFFSY